MLVDTIKKVKNVSVGYVGSDGLFDSATVNAYATSLRGLSATQAEVALSSAGLDSAQRKQIITALEAATATKTLTTQEALSAMTRKVGSAEAAKELLIKSKLVTADQLVAGAEIQVSTEKLKSAVASGVLSQSEANNIAVALGLTGTNVGLGTSFKLLTASIWANIKALAVWLVTNPVGWAILAGGALFGLAKITDALTVSVEEQREKLENLKGEYAEIESELKSLNDELITTQQRMAELEGKGNLTFTEKEEYDNLVKVNNELQRKIDLLELEEKNKRKEKNKAFVSTMEKDTEDPFEYEVDPDGKPTTGQYSIGDEYLTSEIGYIEAQFEIRKQLLDDLSKAETKEEQDRIQDRIDEIDKYLQDKNTQWASDMDGIEYIKNPTTEDEEKVNQWLDFINDFQDRMAIAMGGDNAKTNAFNRVVDNWQFDGTVQELQDLGKQGQVTAEMLNDPKYDSFIQKLYELGVIDSVDNLDAVALAFNNIGAKSENAGGKVNKMTVSLSELEKTSEKIGALSSAFKELHDNGYITVKTLSEIKTATGLSGDQWAEYEAKLLNAKFGSAEYNQIMSELTYKILENQYATLDLTNATDEEVAAIETKIAASLRERGVDNATAVAHDFLNQKRYEAKVATLEAALSEDTFKESLKAVEEETGLTSDAIALMVLKLIDLESTKISLSQQIDEIRKLREAMELPEITGADIYAAGYKYSGKNAEGKDLYSKDGKTVLYDEAYRDVSYDTTKDDLSGGKTDRTNPNYTLEDKSKKNKALEDYLKNAEAQLKFHKDELKYIDDLQYAYDNLAKTDEERADILDKMAKAREDYTKREMEAIDSIQTAYKTLQTALDETDEYGDISVDTLQSLLELEPQYINMIIDENGNLELNRDTVNECTAAYIDNLAAKSALNLIDSVSHLKTEKEQLDLLKGEARQTGDALWDLVAAQLAVVSSSVSPEVGAALAKQVEAIRKMAESAKSGLKNGGLNDFDVAKLEKEHIEKANEYAEKVAEIQNDLAEKEAEFAENMAEAWKEEHLAQLKDGLERQKDLIDRYKKNIEVLDFGLDNIEEDDFSNKADLLSDKLEGLQSYGAAMRTEFERVANTIPQTGEEAVELANRLEELGSDMRDNVSAIRETVVALQMLNIDMASTLINDRMSELQYELDNIDRRINILNSGYKDDYQYASNVLSMDMLLPTYSEYDKKRREKQRADKAIIKTEQETQDKINEIVTKSLEMQAKENAEARAKERQRLIDDMEKARTEAKKKLAEAHQDYLDFLEDNKLAASDAVAEIEAMFADMDIKLPEIDTTSVDDALEKVKEKLGTMFDDMPKLDNLFDGGGATGNAMIDEASKYIGQTNFGGRFSNGRIEPWCADFVSYVAKQIGVDTIPQTASVWNMYDYFKENGRLTQTPSIGAIVMFDWKDGGDIYDHVGIVTDFDDDNIYTIEGNTSNGKVDRKTRPRNGTILGYGLYASGTIDGNSLASRLGIAGENYKPEILIDKTTGKATYIDSPTVIDTSKTDVVGEKATARIPKFATGTLSAEDENRIAGIEDFYNRAVDSISYIEKNIIAVLQNVLNDDTIDDFTKSQKLYGYKHYAEVEASKQGKIIYDELVDSYNTWLKAIDDGTADWSLEVYNAYKDAFAEISQLTYDMADNAVKDKMAAADARWGVSDNWISDRNAYNDWAKYGDSETEAWIRVIQWLKKDYPEELEKIRQAELNLFNTRKNEFSKANSFANEYLNSQKTLLQSHYDVVNAVAEAHHEINKELETSKTMYEYLDEDSRKLLFNQDDYNSLYKELVRIQNTANTLQASYERSLRGATAETIEQITSEYQMQYETLMKSYEIAKADLEVAKKKAKLNNVLNERNVRMFINGSWQWVADTEQVANAKAELADAEYAKRVERSGLVQQESINELTRQQDSLNVIIKQFENGVISLDSAIRYASQVIADMPYELSRSYNGVKVNGKSTYGSSGGVGYDSTVDYMSKILSSANEMDVIEYNKARNAKIDGEGLNETKLSSEEALEEWKKAKGHASGTRYTPGGLTKLGEDGFEAYISSKGQLIPITNPTIGNISGGGVVFNTDQMKNLRTLWDMSNFNLSTDRSYINASQPQQIDQRQDNRIIINGMTVDSGSADGQALISALRRYVGNH